MAETEVTDRVRRLLDEHGPSITNGDRFAFSDLLRSMDDCIDLLTLAELDQVRAALVEFGEREFKFSARSVVSDAEGFIYAGHLMEGDDFHIRPMLWNLVIMNELGMCDVEKVTSFFKEFWTWLSKLPRAHRKMVYDILIEEGLEKRLHNL